MLGVDTSEGGVLTSPAGSFIAVSSSSFHSCAITEGEQTVECWGSQTCGRVAWGAGPSPHWQAWRGFRDLPHGVSLEEGLVDRISAVIQVIGSGRFTIQKGRQRYQGPIFNAQ